MPGECLSILLRPTPPFYPPFANSYYSYRICKFPGPHPSAPTLLSCASSRKSGDSHILILLFTFPDIISYRFSRNSFPRLNQANKQLRKYDLLFSGSFSHSSAKISVPTSPSRCIPPRVSLQPEHHSQHTVCFPNFVHAFRCRGIYSALFKKFTLMLTCGMPISSSMIQTLTPSTLPATTRPAAWLWPHIASSCSEPPCIKKTRRISVRLS